MTKQSNRLSGLPLVSIVIPAYNAADYLREAIDSVLNQSYPNIELIVLDDGSTDNTHEILNSYPKESIYWESHSNMGQSATLNKGWSMAHGDILSYLSADDVLLTSAVSDAAAYFIDSSAVAVYGDYQLIDEKGVVIGEPVRGNFSYKRMISHIDCPIGPGAFFRRAVFVETGGWNISLRQVPDYDFWLKTGVLGEIRHISGFFAQWRIHAGSQTSAKADVAKADEVSKVMADFFELNQLPQEVAEIQSLAMANAHLYCASKHFYAGRGNYTFHHLNQAWRCHPQSLFSIYAIRLLISPLWRRLKAVAIKQVDS